MLNAFAIEVRSVPCSTSVIPVYVFTAPNVSVPVPTFVSEPPPEIEAAIVMFAVPAVSITPPPSPSVIERFVVITLPLVKRRVPLLTESPSVTPPFPSTASASIWMVLLPATTVPPV